jgi:hypothetical protein
MADWTYTVDFSESRESFFGRIGSYSLGSGWQGVYHYTAGRTECEIQRDFPAVTITSVSITYRTDAPSWDNQIGSRIQLFGVDGMSLYDSGISNSQPLGEWTEIRSMNMEEVVSLRAYSKYGDGFYHSDYGWIPKVTILSIRLAGLGVAPFLQNEYAECDVAYQGIDTEEVEWV